MTDSIVALIVIAYFGILSFFAWLLILLLLCGGLWWYKSSCIAFTSCIDFSLLWRPSTPICEPLKLPLVEKETKNVEENKKEVVKSVDLQSETLKMLHSLENDLKQSEKFNNEESQYVFSEKDLNQVVQKSTEPVFSDEYYLKLKEEILSSIKKMTTTKKKIHTNHPSLVPKYIIDEIAEELNFKFLISACVGTTIVKGRSTYYLYVVNLERVKLANIAVIIQNAQRNEYPSIRFENFQNDVLSFFLQFELLNNKFKPELVVVNQIPFVDLKLFSGEGKVLKVDYTQLCDNNYCQELFKIVSKTDGCEEQKSLNGCEEQKSLNGCEEQKSS